MLKFIADGVTPAVHMTIGYLLATSASTAACAATAGGAMVLGTTRASSPAGVATMDGPSPCDALRIWRSSYANASGVFNNSISRHLPCACMPATIFKGRHASRRSVGSRGCGSSKLPAPQPMMCACGHGPHVWERS